MKIFGVILLYVLIFYFTFGNFPNTFFQQDEWIIIANHIFWDEANLDWLTRLFTYGQTTHLIPLSNLFSYIQFKLFDINFFYYAITSIVLHFVNALLVTYLAYIFLRKKILSILAGVFFIANSIPSQAITWIATTTGTAGSTLFFLVSIILFLKYLEVKKKGKVYLIATFIAVFIALGFKESSVFLFALFLPLALLFGEKKKVLKNIFIFTTIVSLLYISIRIFFLLNFHSISQYLDKTYNPSSYTYIYRLIATPLKFFAQSFIPQETILNLADFIMFKAYPQFITLGSPNPFIRDSVVADLVLFISAIVLMVPIFHVALYFWKVKEKRISYVMLFSLFSIFLSSIPLIVLPGKSGYFSLIDGRHFYISSGFTAILYSCFLYGIMKIIPKKKIALILCTGIILLFLIYHTGEIRGKIDDQITIGQTRKSILENILSNYTSLPEKVVFYIESDKAYYGVPESQKIPPFQSGFGQVLIAWYDSHGQELPACFFEQDPVHKDAFLYPLLTQGYKECENKGFGYYRNFDNLLDGVKKNNLSQDTIRAFAWIDKEKKLVNVTKEIQMRIKNSL